MAPAGDAISEMGRLQFSGQREQATVFLKGAEALHTGSALDQAR